MISVGVDLSAEAEKTALAEVHWSGGGAVVCEVSLQVDNPAILRACVRADKVGIDCPFGWPDLFVDFVIEHRQGHVRPRTGRPKDWRRLLANRVTDLVVRETVAMIPLSVSADRIAHAAFRCAALLAELAASGEHVDRSGVTGKVVEVYPAASLNQWQLTSRGYKRAANLTRLDGLVDALRASAPWLDLGAHEPLLRSNDDAFDSVVAALAARAAWLGLTSRPTAEQLAAAHTEGWIALPEPGSLVDLVRSEDVRSPLRPG
ncbi:MAG TPA: DUF429 domain-containing protein [Propionibacteriaceae bacterium]